MAVVTFRGVAKVYPGGARAVSGMDLEIGDGEFVVLVGPSGCGKTTALRMLAGLETITEGTITIGDRVVNHMAPRDRDIAMVFQNYALYPHLKVYDNIAFGLRLRKVPKDEIDKRVRHAAEVLGLEDFLDRKPRALSGGQRQRVAMGRAIVREPQAFLMDEPLSNLDAKLRVQMRSEIGALQRDLGVTTLYVTHDQVEAMTMGDRVAVMRKGELQQVAPPQELYDRPVSLFVAGFIGSPTMNMVEATVEQDDDRLAVSIGDQRLALADEAVQAHPALRGVRRQARGRRHPPRGHGGCRAQAGDARGPASPRQDDAPRGPRVRGQRARRDRRAAGAHRGHQGAGRGHRHRSSPRGPREAGQVRLPSS